MTRSQLITKVANDTNMTSAEVEKVMDGIFGTIGDVLKSGDKVTIAGFGRFEMRERQTKNFTNPKTKVTSKLEPTAIPGFKASGRLKEKVGRVILPPNIGFNARGRCAAGFFVNATAKKLPPDIDKPRRTCYTIQGC